MKNTKNTLLKWVLGACLLFIGAQQSFASCLGTLHFIPPSDWNGKFYVTMNNIHVLAKATKNETTGYYDYDLKNVGAEAYDSTFALYTVRTDGSIEYVFKNVWQGMPKDNPSDKNYPQNNRDIACPNDRGDIYILENPKKLGTTLVAYSKKPEIKYLYVLVPNDPDWKGSSPLYSGDGTFASGKAMKADPNMCGWYYMVWMDETLPENLLIFRDDDPLLEDPIGFDGWNAEETTPIDVSFFFSAYGDPDRLYFVTDEEMLEDPDTKVFGEDPMIDGSCSYSMAAIIYDTDASLHGAFTCNPDWHSGQTPEQAAANACFYAAANFNVVASAAGQVPCIGVTTGMVNEVLSLDKTNRLTYKKPTLTAKGRGCFGASADLAFQAMFNSTPLVNETYCVDLPFTRSSDDKWEFDSDNYLSPGATVAGGFYPAETTPPAERFMSEPLLQAEVKRKAEGPVFMCAGLRAIDPVEGVPYSDLACKGPGWTKGEKCDGYYAGGSEWAGEFNGIEFTGDGWGWSCENEAPSGWPKYVEGTEKAAAATTQKPATRWTSGKSDSEPLTNAGRNQHFCFESHANFKYKKGLRFSFRGDDDIWVFIDNRLAVDLGGTHLAAPGYVDLDNFVGASGELVPGTQYDLDVFFCDRRTTMSNVRIKTNMYIVQKTDIDVKKLNATDFNICYKKSGDGSCAAAMVGGGSEDDVQYCGEQLDPTVIGLPITVYLINGAKSTDAVVDSFTTPGIYRGGLDLTHLGLPKVDKSKMTGLGGGRYSVFISIGGSKPTKVTQFRLSGEVDVVYADGIAKDTDNVVYNIPEYYGNAQYILKKSAMAGEMVPVYISAVTPGEKAGDPLGIYPNDAFGVSYALDADAGLMMYEKVGEAYAPIAAGTKRPIGESGLDTIYVTVPLEDFRDESGVATFHIKVAGRPATNAQSIKFYLPKLSFVEAPVESGNPTPVTGDPKLADGTYEERWTGSSMTFYIAVFAPDENDIWDICKECNFYLKKGQLTSKGIEILNEDDLYFTQGYSAVEVRSMQAYRYDADPTIDNPAVIVIQGENERIKAQYFPIYFQDPPVPFPVLTDVFDVKGAPSSVPLNMPAPYYDPSNEYLDGIADSVAIYYDRKIHKDSLPEVLCLAWDSSSAKKYIPGLEGWSNQPKDSTEAKAVLCNVVVDAATIQAADICSAPDEAGYCTNVLKIGGLKLSDSLKTSGSGSIVSYASFEDTKPPHKIMKQGFASTLTDRVAPIPLAAEVHTIKSGDDLTDYDSLSVLMSEPVRLATTSLDYQKRAFDFFLNSATDLAESARFASLTGGTSTVVQSPSAPVLNGKRVKVTYLRGTTSPHVNDYVRMAGNLGDLLIWSDDASNNAKNDSIRTAYDQQFDRYKWSSPVSLDRDLGRLPTPWVKVKGDAEIKVVETKFAHTGNVTDPNAPAIAVSSFDFVKTDEEVLAEMNGVPGHLVSADMYSLIRGLSADQIKNLNMDEVYFYYKVEYFTNLGNFVASKSEKIFCDDAKNEKNYFGPDANTPGKCYDVMDPEKDNSRKFFIAWNMKADNNRMVGTGAYISKMESYVKLGDNGKEAKQESTSVFGVRRSAAPCDDKCRAAH